MEYPNDARLAGVKHSKGAITQANVDNMTQIDAEKALQFEKMLDFLLDNNVEIIVYLQPFSVTSCYYIYDENTNPVFTDVEEYLHCIGEKKGIEVVGSYDSRIFDITDEYFIDAIHLDRAGTRIVWQAYM